VIVEHFLGRAATEVLHNAILLLTSLNTPIAKMLARQQARCIPRRVVHQREWEGYLCEVRAGLRVVASCSSLAKVDLLSRCSERTEVSEEDANRAVVRRWIETFNNPYTPQTEVDVLAPDYVAHAPGLPASLELEAWTQFTASFVEAFPDLRLTVEDIFCSEDMVAARVGFRGTHRGEFQGIPPTGKEVAFSSIEIDRMVEGKVEEHWFEMDLLGLMGHLGAIPEPEHSEEASPPSM
jgi:predicted ester cyclase